MRIAQERVLLLTTAEHVRAHAGACAESLYLHKAIVRRGIMAVVSAATAAVSFRMFRKKEKTDSPRISAGVGVGRYFAAKLATAVLIPWLRKVMVDSPDSAPRKKGFIRRLISRS